jgi:16S rRNA (cytosine1402-N4)-methyltransferase
MTYSPVHVPVLLQEVLTYLAPLPDKLYIDATLGGGGHSLALLTTLQSLGLSYHLIGIDQDPYAMAQAQEKLASFQEHCTFIQANYSQLQEVLSRQGIDKITGGVLADLGVSSFQLDQGERGFSFSKEAPLDMRMSPETPLTAEIIVNEYDEKELVQIFSEYGEERFSKTIARNIVAHRNRQPIRTTKALAELVWTLYNQKGPRSKIHPATKVFQALRIAVNDELGHLSRFLEQLPDILAPEARVVIISFHSLEDRIVKQFFQKESRDCLCPPQYPICQCGHKATLKILTSKPVVATQEEIKNNPRSRSAKLRAAMRK